jgi:dienelactone hydrolase
LQSALLEAAVWISAEPDIADLPLGLFGASTGAGAAMLAAAELQGRVGAVVSRGGRPDLAGSRLTEVSAPSVLPSFCGLRRGVRKESGKAEILWKRILVVLAGFVCCFLAERDSPA